MKKRHILVTGGAGFIGSHIARRHHENGDDVWVVDNLQTGRKNNIEPYLSNSSFKFDDADIQTWPKLQEAANWADRIYHMAADVGQRFVIAHPLHTLPNNIQSFELLLEAVAQSKSKPRLVLASTSGLYRHCRENQKDGSREDSLVSFPAGEYLQENYPISKLVNEVMLLGYVREKGIHASIARLFNTIGTNQTSAYGMVVPTFIGQALTNQPLTVYGDGLQTRSFCNVNDTARGMELILETDATKGEILNVGNNIECTILDLAKKIIARTGSQSKIQFIPYKEAYGVDFVDVMSRRPNLQKIERLTGYRPERTLEQTIDELVSTYHATHKKQLVT